MNDMNWSFYNVWNESLLQQKSDKKYTSRSHIWASEMGGAMVDRYLKMTGVQPTNPPNMRSLRKFEAGNIWEWIITLVLRRVGILIDTQQWISHQYPDLLEVTGYLDVLAGGNPDWEKAKAEIQDLTLPNFIQRATNDLVDHFKEKYPNGLNEVVLEMKSCSSFMFDVYERNKAANPNHRLQTFHYLKSKNMQEGHIVYICKDDARMLEIGVLNPSYEEDNYKADIEAITKYIRAKEQPPLEKMIVFDNDFGRFSANWKVAYSQYLTHLYGLENQMQFDNIYKKKAAGFNRVIKRIAEGKKMTAANEEILVDMRKQFNDIDPMVEIVKSKLKSDDKEEEEEDQT